ncbi:MAG: DMT family transporter [Candidatus Micrarchaeota archaeon]
MELGILLALSSALGWGVADSLSFKASHENGPATALFYSIAIGAVAYGVAVLFGPPISLSFPLLAVISVAAVFFTVANAAFFVAMREGEASVVSPLNATFALPVLVLSAVFLGERLTPIQLVFCLCIIAGAVLVSFKWSTLSKQLGSARTVKGVKLSLLSALGYGVCYTLIKPAVTATSGAFVFLCFMLLGLPFYYVFLRSRSGAEPGLCKPWPVVAMSLAYTAAQITFGESVRLIPASLAASVSSAFPLIVAVIAYFFFRERLEFNQYAGILLIVAGVAGLSA